MTNHIHYLTTVSVILNLASVIGSDRITFMGDGEELHVSVYTDGQMDFELHASESGGDFVGQLKAMQAKLQQATDEALEKGQGVAA